MAMTEVNSLERDGLCSTCRGMQDPERSTFDIFIFTMKRPRATRLGPYECILPCMRCGW